MIFSVSAFAAKGRKEDCIEPHFSRFAPAHLSEVPPQSDFSFAASRSTVPETLEVTVKKVKADFVIEDRNIYYKVVGKLPASLKGTFARVSIRARDVMECLGQGGWLLKITEGDEADDPEPVEIEKVETSE